MDRNQVNQDAKDIMDRTIPRLNGLPIGSPFRRAMIKAHDAAFQARETKDDSRAMEYLTQAQDYLTFSSVEVV